MTDRPPARRPAPPVSSAPPPGPPVARPPAGPARRVGGTRVRVHDHLTVLPARLPPPPAHRGSATDREVELGRSNRKLRSLGRRVQEPNRARSTSLMALGTVLSRLTGFGRILAVGWVLGGGGLADAYIQANTIPNTVYDLLLGGILSATLLPVFLGQIGGQRAYEDREGWRGILAVVNALAAALVVVTGLFWLGAPAIIRFFLIRAHGAVALQEERLATTLLRLFVLQLLLLGLITLSTAILNARRRFGAVAFSPVLNNVVTIAALIGADRLAPHATLASFSADHTAVWVLGLGTTLGYLVQLLAQLPGTLRTGFRWRPVWDLHHPALVSVVRLSGWTIGAVIANQVSLTLVSQYANTVRGNLSLFNYAYTFMQLPYAVIAVSVISVVAPDLAERWLAGDRRGFARRFDGSTRLTLAVLVPAGVGYALVANPVIRVALAHGDFPAPSAPLAATLLALFAIGLPGFSGYLLVMRALQSKQDTKSMCWLYAVENAITVLGAALLYPHFGVRGLVVAWIGAYTVALPVAWWWLRRSVPVRLPTDTLVRVGIATVLMGGAVGALEHLVPHGQSTVVEAVRLLCLVGVGAAVYLVAARLLHVEELATLWRRFRPARR